MGSAKPVNAEPIEDRGRLSGKKPRENFPYRGSSRGSLICIQITTRSPDTKNPWADRPGGSKRRLRHTPSSPNRASGRRGYSRSRKRHSPKPRSDASRSGRGRFLVSLKQDRLESRQPFTNLGQHFELAFHPLPAGVVVPLAHPELFGGWLGVGSRSWEVTGG